VLDIEPHAIVLYGETQMTFGADRADPYRAAADLGREAMYHGILDQRLQQHWRHRRLEEFIGSRNLEAQAIIESLDFDFEIGTDGLKFCAQ
jgi:hypothetical protein